MADVQEEGFIRAHQLQDIHDRLSKLFAGPLDDAGIAHAEALLALARTVRARPSGDTKWDLWEKHFRVNLDAIDLPAITAPAPAPGPAPDLSFLSATGRPLSAAEVRDRAAGAQVLFYAAGDEVYVDRYGPYYTRSVLRKCDVPCLAIVHVIGGKAGGRAARIAETIGIQDDRLIYAADGFDAAAVTTRAHDAPVAGPVRGAQVHFQSARFLALGSLLRLLDRPVFVTDIDLLLERGVGDLLDRTAADVVLNENDPATSLLGAMITANLVLVRPTAHGLAFAAFLRDYLERHLARPDVSRWIDQLALLHARHYLARRPGARLDRFDVTTDINNKMLPHYGHTRFRFLALYAGFDLTSLHGLYPGAVSRR